MWACGSGALESRPCGDFHSRRLSRALAEPAGVPGAGCWSLERPGPARPILQGLNQCRLPTTDYRGDRISIQASLAHRVTGRGRAAVCETLEPVFGGKGAMKGRCGPNFGRGCGVAPRRLYGSAFLERAVSLLESAKSKTSRQVEILTSVTAGSRQRPIIALLVQQMALLKYSISLWQEEPGAP